MLEQTGTTTPHRAAAPRAAAAALDLDALAALPYGELEAMYRAAAEPSGVRGVDGKPLGRMLAVRSLSGGILGGWLRAFAGSRSFVWDGKTFTSIDDRRGRGINRVSLPGVLGKQSLFPFETRVDASAVDGRRAIILDYDLPENPAYIRAIHDEIREVEPGLYLGPAMVKTGRGPVTVLWFALDTRCQSAWS